jgi:hypothetical protein
MKPITGRAGCCVRTASGQATAAPPRNSRRLIASPRLSGRDHCSRLNMHVEVGKCEFRRYKISRAANVADGSWLCKNVATRDDDRINVLPNRV